MPVKQNGVIATTETRLAVKRIRIYPISAVAGVALVVMVSFLAFY